MSPSPRARLGAGGVLVAIIVFGVVLAAAVRTEGTAYDWWDNMLSDLGDPSCHVRGGRWICSPGAEAFNAGLIGVGVLLLVSALLLTGMWGRVLAAGVAVMGGGLVIAGVFPAGNDGALHLAGVVLALVVPGLALLAASVRPETSWLASYRWPRGALAVVALLLCAESRLPHALLPRGASELVIAGCLLVALGAEALRVVGARTR
ncbi:MAG: DUF998 domain-containing protein [Propionibacteriaceae bacterium]|nr:DUF998 domain-containing protein [Propionibacteriaceae bacterium]